MVRLGRTPLKWPVTSSPSPGKHHSPGLQQRVRRPSGARPHAHQQGQTERACGLRRPAAPEPARARSCRSRRCPPARRPAASARRWDRRSRLRHRARSPLPPVPAGGGMLVAAPLGLLSFGRDDVRTLDPEPEEARVENLHFAMLDLGGAVNGSQRRIRGSDENNPRRSPAVYDGRSSAAGQSASGTNARLSKGGGPAGVSPVARKASV